MNSADQMSVYAEVLRKGGLDANIVNGKNGGVFVKLYEQMNLYNSTTGQFGVENTPEGRAAFYKNMLELIQTGLICFSEILLFKSIRFHSLLVQINHNIIFL